MASLLWPDCEPNADRSPPLPDSASSEIVSVTKPAHHKLAIILQKVSSGELKCVMLNVSKVSWLSHRARLLCTCDLAVPWASGTSLEITHVGVPDLYFMIWVLRDALQHLSHCHSAMSSFCLILTQIQFHLQEQESSIGFRAGEETSAAQLATICLLAVAIRGHWVVCAHQVSRRSSASPWACHATLLVQQLVEAL